MVKVSKLFMTVKQLCDEENITIAQLERNLLFSEGSISKWKHTNPSCYKITTVAEYFNVSLDYIVGRTPIKYMNRDILHDTDILSIQIARERMNDEEKEKMMMLLKLSFQDKF